MNAQHTPFMPVRNSHAEAVFLSMWQELNANRPYLLPEIIDHSRCSVRQSRVAASFIAWIGCNTGAIFLDNAKAMIPRFPDPQSAYLCAWAIANKRQRWMNSGVRAIEVILSPESLFQGDGSNPLHRASQLAITQSDLDVIEGVAMWLSTNGGNAFVDACEAKHKAIEAGGRCEKRLDEHFDVADQAARPAG